MPFHDRGRGAKAVSKTAPAAGSRQPSLFETFARSASQQQGATPRGAGDGGAGDVAWTPGPAGQGTQASVKR